MMIEFIKDGNVCSPKGYAAAALHCGLKKSGKSDLCMLISEKNALAAGAFTSNKFCAAPVLVCKEHLSAARYHKAIIINSGNANACTGSKGLANAKKMAEITAKLLNIPTESVLVSSTGRIGVQLPMEKIKNGIREAVAKLSKENGHLAAEAIMTTDLVKKECAVSFKSSDGKTITIGAMTKGSGMISPNMQSFPHATMLSYITTDASVEKKFLRKVFSDCIEKTFNKITVDGDMSTNDTVIMMANGAAENKIIKSKSPDAEIFREALLSVMTKMAKSIVADGEGASKFITINVTNAKSEHDAELCARAIANSMLCKTAWFGGDPNWGRIVAAAGYSGAEFSPEKVSLYYNKTAVIKNGKPCNTPEEKLAKEISQKEFTITLQLNNGKKSSHIWTCDLSYDYVKINADYRT